MIRGELLDSQQGYVIDFKEQLNDLYNAPDLTSVLIW